MPHAILAITLTSLLAGPPPADEFQWRSDLDESLALAAKEKKPVLLVFR